MSDPLRDALDDHLPARVVVGQNGAYWRDFTDDPDHPGYSMCPVSTDNDPVEPIAVYVRLIAPPKAGLREEPWRPLDGHNHDGEGYPTFPVFRVACPQGCDAASAPLPDGRPRSVVIDPLDPRLLRSIGVPPSVADAADASSRGGAPPPEAGLREAARMAFDWIDNECWPTGAEYVAEGHGMAMSPREVERAIQVREALRAALPSPADPPSEPVEYTPSGLRYPTLDELNGGPVRTDLPMLRPADPDMEERLREDLRAIYTAAGWTVYLDDRSGRSLEFLAARLIAQGWRR